MIRINLLPEELQKAASVARTLFMCMLGGASACVILGFVVISLHFRNYQLSNVVEARRIEVEKRKDQAAEVDRINEDIAFYKEREKAIIEIKSQRILWSKKLAELAELTPADIWITEMDMRMLDPTEYKWDGKREQTGGRLSLTCYAEGREVASLTNFRKALAGNKRFYKDLIDVRALPDNFFGDFMGFLAPGWTVVQLDGYAQQDSLRFNMDMDLKPLVEKPKEPAKKKKKKKKAE